MKNKVGEPLMTLTLKHYLKDYFIACDNDTSDGVFISDDESTRKLQNIVVVNVNYNKYLLERHQISYNQLAQLGLSLLGGIEFSLFFRNRGSDFLHKKGSVIKNADCSRNWEYDSIGDIFNLITSINERSISYLSF